MKLADYLNKNYTLEEISSLTELNCSGKGITSIEGIENCTSLTKLYYYKNQITSLKGLEGCTSLTKLYCFNNQLTSLKGIEGYTSLTHLNCSNNQLSSRSLYRSLKDLKTLKYVNGTTFDKYISLLKTEALKETLKMLNI